MSLPGAVVGIVQRTRVVRSGLTKSWAASVLGAGRGVALGASMFSGGTAVCGCCAGMACCSEGDKKGLVAIRGLLMRGELALCGEGTAGDSRAGEFGFRKGLLEFRLSARAGGGVGCWVGGAGLSAKCTRGSAVGQLSQCCVYVVRAGRSLERTWLAGFCCERRHDEVDP
jgi:hypothetical protein